MASGIDYNALRGRVMETGQAGAVTVNMRALIDKILARYAREWTTLRELLQNAADATATKVIIKIETSPSVQVPFPQGDDPSARLKHVLQHHVIDKWIVENDGMRFRPEDWARLKEIATGNPDETKIGSFGVGFYSVFALTDDPLVFSGSETLSFYWEGNSLMTRYAKDGLFEGSKNTTFVLGANAKNKTYRIPQGDDLVSLCRFLTGSMTFLELESIEFWVDEWRILNLKKSMASEMSIDIPSNMSRNTSGGWMRIVKTTNEASQLEAEWMKVLEGRPGQNLSPILGASVEPAKRTLRSFFKSFSEPSAEIVEKPVLNEGKAAKIDLLATSKQKVFYHVDKAVIKTMPDRGFVQEYEMTRKKRPPATTTVSFVTQSYEEHIASDMSGLPMAARLFSTVVSKEGYILIGFQTSQTTSLSGHLAIPAVVPTVEREQIDLNSESYKIWNVELLRVAGVVARLSWTSEMSNFKRRLTQASNRAQGGAIPAKDLNEIIPAVKYLHEKFHWSRTTPLLEVGDYVQKAFWHCSEEFDILSSCGVVPALNTRVASEDMSFVEELPVIPGPLLDTSLLKLLRKEGVVNEAQIEDVLLILEKATRSATQLELLLQWIVTKARTKSISKSQIRSLLNAAVATDSESEPKKLLAVSEMKNFVNPDRISPEMPVPPSTIPFRFTKKLGKFDTDALGFEDLQIVPWLQWLVDSHDDRKQLSEEQDLTTAPTFASNVLRVVSKQWNGLTPASKSTVTALLENRTIVPTKMGLKKPADAYFSSVKLFDDLPIVNSLSNVKEPFLSAIGVRRTIEIGLLIERLMGESSQAQSGVRWSQSDLVKYLVKVWADVPKADRQLLQITPICSAETPSGPPSTERHRIPELYEPNDDLRRLGLPILHWPGTFNPVSNEAKLLRSLGLRDYPPFSDLVNIIAIAGRNKSITLRERALKYLVINYQSKGYDLHKATVLETSYLPIQGSEDKLSTPINCFTNHRSAVLGFDILRHDLHAHASKLSVTADPPIEACVKRLMKDPPRTARSARDIFTYMAGRLGSINNQQAEILGQARIIPLQSKSETEEKRQGIRLVAPYNCYLGSGGPYVKIFEFVDFGQAANAFLIRCGSKNEPATPDLAALLTEQPARLLAEFGEKKYKDLLVQISWSWETLKGDQDLLRAMEQAPFLLASKELIRNAPAPNDEEDEQEDTMTWEIAQASNIVAVDDQMAYQVFKADVFAAPQEERLENMYLHLGASRLSNLVEEQQKIGELMQDQSRALTLQSTILERARLYLHHAPKESIRHHIEWLEKNLNVQNVQSIKVRKSLRGHGIQRLEDKTATLSQKRTTGFTILVTERYNMWQVSQTLVKILLHRPQPNDAIALEQILQSGLHGLKEMGFNVNRILRRQEKEFRIKQDTYRQQLEREERARKEREAMDVPSEKEKDIHPPGQAPIPGEFPANEEKPHQPEETSEPESIFSGFGKMFGLDIGRTTRPVTHDQRSIDNGHTHRRLKDKDAVHLDPEPSNNDPKQQSRLSRPLNNQETKDRVGKAIQMSRPHQGADFKGEIAPHVHKVEEIFEHCEARAGMDLSFVGYQSNMQIYIDRQTLKSQNMSGSNFLESNREDLNLFVSLLVNAAAVFQVDRKTMNIFYDDLGPTMAFNRSRSLFFNYRYFKASGHPAMIREGNTEEPLNWWAVRLSHEMAHNLERDHNVRFQNIHDDLVLHYMGLRRRNSPFPANTRVVS